ncbi:glutathione S-transferase [Afipia sp. P52-10]|jgi:glutathione S-transferase|uniref:glutathione S-transferase family protein n=1 Tax=Afipia sp. P52-10 TaxID=1429916 RepID=UPI0003DF1962|nr:glutathione S-transferase N-terminal domain-containing protein [Afipia sp. P52-10]ETR76219.1 glutathione S-transferase [Afipia sp. P52-10]
MKLFWSSRSPFVRKVMVAVHEIGVADRIETQRVVVSANNPNAEVMAINPLNKIPTLIRDDGSAIYDSRVICEFLDQVYGKKTLFPSDPARRWEALRRQALGDGLMEVIVLLLGERARAEGLRSEPHLSTHQLKIKTTLDCLEREAPPPPADTVDIGDIAIASGLSHLDFRFAADNWRQGRAKLAAWHAAMAGRPSMKATEFADVY